MRKLLLLPAVAALLGAGSAEAATLRAHRVLAADDVHWLGQAGPDAVAWRTKGFEEAPAIVRYDDGRVATVPAPAGCDAQTVGSGRVGYICGIDEVAGQPRVIRHVAVSSLAGDDIARIDAEVPINGPTGHYPVNPAAVGDQWIRSLNGDYHSGEWWEDINWHTGEVRENHEPDLTQVADLDAADLMVPLCAPLRAVPIPSPDDSLSRWPVTVHGRWALIDHNYSWNGDWTSLYRCGSSKPVHLFPAATSGTPSLGDGWAGQAWTLKPRGWRVEIVRLADRRRVVVSGLPRLGRGGSVSLTFTAGRAYLVSHIDHKIDRAEDVVFTVKLPAREASWPASRCRRM